LNSDHVTVITYSYDAAAANSFKLQNGDV